jgi:hypothetical protein
MKTLPSLKKKYLYSKDFAKASIPELLGKDKIEASVRRKADTFASTYFENVSCKGPDCPHAGELAYKAHPLPDVFQFSTMNSAMLCDLNGDGKKEVLMGGNFYDCNIEMGRYDAYYAKVLTIGANGQMQASSLGNPIIKGQTRHIRPVVVHGKPCYVFARNNDRAVILQ